MRLNDEKENKSLTVSPGEGSVDHGRYATPHLYVPRVVCFDLSANFRMRKTEGKRGMKNAVRIPNFLIADVISTAKLKKVEEYHDAAHRVSMKKALTCPSCSL